jgi:hypothetical protein
VVTRLVELNQMNYFAQVYRGWLILLTDYTGLKGAGPILLFFMVFMACCWPRESNR